MKSGHGRRAVGAALFAILLAGCQSAPRDTHEGLQGVLWVQQAAEFELAATQAYRQALAIIPRALADRGWTAAVEQDGTDFAAKPPAVVLDLDETVLDNAAFQGQLALDRATFDPAIWSGWVSRSDARLIPGAQEFLAFLAAGGVKAFFISNRTAAEEPATVRNLTRLGVAVAPDGADVLSQNERPGWGSDKTARRKAVADTHRILMLIGDDLNDFVPVGTASPDERKILAARYRSRWGERWIILPNPLYGSWDRAVVRGATGDAEVLQKKFGAIEGFK